MCPHLSANYVLGCPSNMAQVSVWAGNLQKYLIKSDSLLSGRLLSAYYVQPYDRTMC